MFSPHRKRSLLVFLLVLMLALTVTVAYAGNKAKGGPVTVGDMEYLGIATFETGDEYAGTEVGGFSGLAYDGAEGVYYVLSDDRSENDPSRFYTVEIDVSDGTLDDGDVTFVDVTFLTDAWGNLFGFRAIDPESIDLTSSGELYISTEGDDVSPPIEPFVSQFSLAGMMGESLPLPDKFLYGDKSGNHVRDNLAFESLTSSPNGRYLFVATENALNDDGPTSTLDHGSPSRFLEFQMGLWRPRREFVYMVDPIPNPPDPPGAFADHGLVEIQALDNFGNFLAMERSFAVGFGNTILLYETSIHGATNVANKESIADAHYQPMEKRLIADIEADFPVDPDNVEGMAIGPMLGDGRYLLILVSDNNFNDVQTTQFIAFAVELNHAEP